MSNSSNDIQMTFSSLKTELDHLRHVHKLDIKQTSQPNTIEVTIHKALVILFTLSDSIDEYPPKSQSSQCELISADLKALKPIRISTITEFIEETNEYLKAVLTASDDMSIKNICMDVNARIQGDPFVRQSLDILANQKCIFNNLPSEASISKSMTRGKNKKSISNNFQDEVQVSKFKGSEFLFQRFKWDASIDKSRVTIGYLDRFKGIQEIPFEEFKGVHDDLEGIPQHRIRYYKIDDKVVWDREKKINLLSKTGDIAHFFNNNEVSDEINSIEESDCEKTLSVDNETAATYAFISNSWEQTVNNSSQEIQFLSGFKILTYNVLSKFNFRRSLQETMKRAKHSAGLDCGLDQVDRMEMIIESFTQSPTPDIILLQECDKYEQSKLRQSRFIQRNYYMSYAADSESHLVILSKLKPTWVRSLDLCPELSRKTALCVNFQFKTSSLNTAKELILCNIHLTSGKALNFFEKRRQQMTSLKNYFIGDSANNADYILMGGDFNFGDDEHETNDQENKLIDQLFLQNGFRDMVPGHPTFDPVTNFSAILTSHKMEPRRLDRILFKARDPTSFLLKKKCLFNTAPFELTTLPPHHVISYNAYKNITHFHLNQSVLISDDSEEASTERKPVEACKYYLHLSDHYGLQVNIDFEHSLHEASLAHTNALAFVIPKHSSQRVQALRNVYDPQVRRWPPHINCLYPFFDLEPMGNKNDQESVIADLIHVASQFEAFPCSLGEVGSFDKVIYLKPDQQSTAKMQQVHGLLINQVFKHIKQKWKKDLTPHCTIAQPTDKKNASCKSFVKDNIATVCELFDIDGQGPLEFYIDCIHWLQRPANKPDQPFEIKFSFPFGKRFPSIIHNLNPIEIKTPNNVLNFLTNHGMILSELEDRALVEQKAKVEQYIQGCQISDIKLFDLGSYQLGVKCNDLDFAIVTDSSDKANEISSYLAQSCSEIFPIVRNVEEASVPIIELQLYPNVHIESVDLQINKLNKGSAIGVTNSNLFFDYMSKLSFEEYRQLFTLSAIYENCNLRKYIADYKVYQVLVSFVKYWAKRRHVYGKGFGYLSGCSWSIMVIYYLSKRDDSHVLELNHSADRFEKAIRGFFKFYSEYEWSREIVSLVNVAHVVKTTAEYQEKKPMMILQSVFPYYNTASSVQDVFKKIIVKEIQRAASIENYEDICEELEMTDKVLRFTIEFKDSSIVNHVLTLVKGHIGWLLYHLRKTYHRSEIRPCCGFDNCRNSSGNIRTYSIGFVAKEGLAKERINGFCNDFISEIRRRSHSSQFDMNYVFINLC